MMDFFLEAWVSGIIEGKKVQWMMGKSEPWRPGEKLKLLFAGYNGTRNTGPDVRAEEMLRQVRQILLHAPIGPGIARGGDASASSTDSRTRTGRAQHDDL